MYTDIFGFGTVAFALIFLLIILIVIDKAIPKSRIYRKYLTNMFVAAMIRKMAKKEGLVLEDEEKGFLAYSKKAGKRYSRELDNRIEEELAEKIEEATKNLKGGSDKNDK